MNNQSTNIWSFVNSIFYQKDQELFTDETAQLYNPFIINRALSQHFDTVLYANEMNQRAHLPKHMQYGYLVHAVRKQKRYSKWPKKLKEENIAIVQEWYNCSVQTALEFLDLLTEEQLDKIKELLYRGGLKK